MALPPAAIPLLDGLDPQQPGVVTEIQKRMRPKGSMWSTEAYGGGIPVITPLCATLGLVTPLQRGLAFSSLTAATLWLVAPSSMFVRGPTGIEGRSWSLLASPDDRDSTLLPWWLASFLVGVVLAGFV